MKEVIRIDAPQVTTEKPVEFTHYLDIESGWCTMQVHPNCYKKVVYLGKCPLDGDMFAAYGDDDCINIFKGHLNSGRY